MQATDSTGQVGFNGCAYPAIREFGERPMQVIITIDLPSATEDQAREIGNDLLGLLSESVSVGAYEPIDTEDLRADFTVESAQ